MKYIMLETTDGKKLPVIFPNDFIHAEVEKYMVHCLLKHTEQLSHAVSAGFVDVGLDTTTHGESETLNLKAKGTDAAYIALGEGVNMMPDYMVGQLLQKAKSKKR